MTNIRITSSDALSTFFTQAKLVADVLKDALAYFRKNLRLVSG